MKLYLINYKDIYKELYQLEIKHLIGFIPTNKYFISDLEVDVNASTFFKGAVSVDFQADSLASLVKQVMDAGLFYESYKIEYIKLDQDVDYETRLKAMRDIGYAIEGEFKKTGALQTLRVTKVENKWIFGRYQRNDFSWQERIAKPNHYSIALETRLARSLVNIASYYGDKIVDPCCGIGTIVIEGKMMGIHIDGFDINRKIVWYSQKNLEHYGLSPDTRVSDIADIKDYYDVAIVDLPYGKFVKKDKEMQSVIFKSAKKIAKTVIFIAMEDKSNEFKAYGYQLLDYCTVPKVNSFKRYVYIVRGV
jgi:tRNA G10  N-methylase Trm11